MVHEGLSSTMNPSFALRSADTNSSSRLKLRASHALLCFFLPLAALVDNSGSDTNPMFCISDTFVQPTDSSHLPGGDDQLLTSSVKGCPGGERVSNSVDRACRISRLSSS